MMLILNVLLFQAAWCASIFGAAAGHWWLGPSAMLAVVAFHLLLAPTRAADRLLVPAAAAIGIFAECIAASLSGTRFAAHIPTASPIPLWMAAIWPGFATMLNSCLAWMQSRPAAAALFGAVGGPLAYWAGARAGALQLGDAPLTPLLIVAAQYALLMPLLCALARRCTPRSAPPMLTAHTEAR